jgi:PIN domain
MTHSLTRLGAMRLKQPGNIDNAIQSIRNLAFQLENTRSSTSADARRDAMLQWFEDQARPILEHLLDPAEDIISDIDAAYNRLLMVPSDLEQPRLYSMLNREYTRWGGRFRQVEAELQQQKLMIGNGSVVVLDTSVLMEGEPFVTFDWRGFHPSLTTGAVRLVLPIIVIDELDALLHDRDGERKKKAREARRVLMSVHPGNKPAEAAPLPGKPDVTLQVLVDDPWRVRLPNNDAEIIDQTLRLHQTTGRAMLATCDLNQYYRAGAVEVAVMLFPRKDGLN